MRYSLRTLHLLIAVGPLLLALVYWTVQWLLGRAVHPTLLAVVSVAYLAAAILGPLLCYRELIEMICGPDTRRLSRRKSRRKVRVRIERQPWEFS